ncbi:AAA family ATPase [Mesorhizobium sp. f-mel]
MYGLDLNGDLLANRLDGASFGGRATGVKKRPYLPDDSLTTAAALAVLLGQPLLLSGLPGVGKTGAAYHIASSLFGDGQEPIRVTVTTQTSGRDLLYKFDLLTRFHDDKIPLRRLLRFEALGRAIATACGSSALVLDAATDQPVTEPSRIAAIVGDAVREPGPLLLRDLFQPVECPPDKPQPSVVLIDEIDKAPRDTPNDLLESFEAMRFTIDELGLKIGAKDAANDDAERRRSRPVIVATTNAENNLPDAFLRRCVFHEIAMPGEEQLKKIVFEHLRTIDKLDEGKANELANAAFAVGDEVAKRIKGSSRAPGTAEYIALARAVHVSPITAADFRAAMDGNIKAPPLDLIKALLGVLVKTADDLGKALEIFPSLSATR